MEESRQRKQRLRSKLRVAAVFTVLALVLAFLIYFSLVALGRAPLPRLEPRPAATAEALPAATEAPTATPKPSPTPSPRSAPSPHPPAAVSEEPSAEPAEQTAPVSTPVPTAESTPMPTATPTAEPTPMPTAMPTAAPTPAPTATPMPTPAVSAAPTAAASPLVTEAPLPGEAPGIQRDKSPILPVDLQGIGRMDWRLQIANYNLRLAEDYEPDKLVMIENWQFVDRRIEGPLRELFRAARNAGYSLYFCSGFRNYDTQAGIYWRNVNNYMHSGYSFEQADALTRLSVNVPGASEHQLGLTADILEYAGQDMLSYIGGSGLMAWLEKNCTQYGFIIRYPEGKTEITGVDYEPWHLRYVGTAAAEYITQNDLCLEEFLELYIQRQAENRSRNAEAELAESQAPARGKNS